MEYIKIKELSLITEKIEYFKITASLHYNKNVTT